MSIKKIAAILGFALLTPFVFASELDSFLEQNGEKASTVGSAINAAMSSAVGSNRGGYKYNYTPMVFELTTTHHRTIYVLNGVGEKVNISYKDDGLWGEGAGDFEAKCYGTLLNKDYMLTHKSCLELPEMDYNDPDLLEEAWLEWEPISMEFKKDGRKLYFNMKHIGNNYWIDEKSGAALVKISNLCLQKHATSASNVCVAFWEWATSSEGEKFSIKNNYGTVILSNINANDNVEDAFLGRSFFTPFGEHKSAFMAREGFLVLQGKAKKSLLGEPVFHRANGTTNVLVGIKQSSEPVEKTISYTKTNTYFLFSSDFTKLIKNNVKTGGIRLTKDLKAQTSL